MGKQFRLKNYPSIIPALEDCFRSHEPGLADVPMLSLWINEKTREFSAHEPNFNEKDTYEVCSLGHIWNMMRMFECAEDVDVKRCAEDILDSLYYDDNSDGVEVNQQMGNVLGELQEILESPCLSDEMKERVELAIELLSVVEEEIKERVEENL